MGSSYFGEPNTGNERSGGSSSPSSRKGKKGNTEKAHRQPQRGLGVAQLEKIRLTSQLGCTSYLPNSLHHSTYPTNLNQEDIRLQTAYSSVPSSTSSYGFLGHQNIVMGLGELERPNLGNPDSQPSTTPSHYPGSGTLETPHFAQPSMTRHFLLEDSSQKKRKKDRGSDSIGSNCQNSNTSDGQELDLELRLSL